MKVKRRRYWNYDWTEPPVVAVIGAYGAIIPGKSRRDFVFGGRVMGSETISQQIKKAREDGRVEAIVLRVDSGGGSAMASDEILEEIVKTREAKKPIVVSMGDMATSGGYWISAMADRIVADPATITGSIGVAGAKPVLSKLYEKLKIRSETFKRGKYSDMFSLSRHFTEEEMGMIEKAIDECYQLFVEKVAEGRGLTKAQVDSIAQGRTYTGRQALQVKLVDKLGGLSEAIDLASDLAGIVGKRKVVFYRQKGKFLKEILGEGGLNLPLHW